MTKTYRSYVTAKHRKEFDFMELKGGWKFISAPYFVDNEWRHNCVKEVG